MILCMEDNRLGIPRCLFSFEAIVTGGNDGFFPGKLPIPLSSNGHYFPLHIQGLVIIFVDQGVQRQTGDKHVFSAGVKDT